MYITKRNHNQSTNEEVVFRGREFFCSCCRLLIIVSLSFFYFRQFPVCAIVFVSFSLANQTTQNSHISREEKY